MPSRPRKRVRKGTTGASNIRGAPENTNKGNHPRESKFKHAAYYKRKTKLAEERLARALQRQKFDIDELQIALEKSEYEVARLKTSLKTFDSRLVDLTTDLSTLTKQNKTLRATNASLNVQLLASAGDLHVT